jgi:hypothetical protein
MKTQIKWFLLGMLVLLASFGVWVLWSLWPVFELMLKGGIH